MFKPFIYVLSLAIVPAISMAQYGDAYHAPNQEAIRKATYDRQQAQSDQHFRNIAPAASNSSGTTVAPASNSNYSPYAAEHQAKMEAYERKANASLEAWEAKEAIFRRLSADVSKNEENYHRLVSLAEQAGFDYYDATRINGRYAPKVIKLPYLLSYQQQRYDAYLKAAAEYRDNNWKELEARAIRSALDIQDDPYLRMRAAKIYYEDLKMYDSAAGQYKAVQENPVNDKPSISSVYIEWGKAALLAEDYQKAIHLMRVYRENYKNEMVSLNLSYAYFLSKQYDAAFGQLLEPSDYPSMTHINLLLQNYYLIRAGSMTEARALFEQNKQVNNDVPLSGDMKKDLAQMLSKFIRKAGKENIPIYSFYLLDVAVVLDPGNMDFIETRYGYNTKMKRLKQAQADEALLTQ